jgi:hypothetical protein
MKKVIRIALLLGICIGIAATGKAQALTIDALTVSPNPAVPGEKCIVSFMGYIETADIIIMRCNDHSLIEKGVKAKDETSFSFTADQPGKYKIYIYPKGFTLPFCIKEITIAASSTATTALAATSSIAMSSVAEAVITPNPTTVGSDFLVNVKGYYGKITCVTYSMAGANCGQRDGDNPLSVPAPDKGVFIIAVFPRGFIEPIARVKVVVN